MLHSCRDGFAERFPTPTALQQPVVLLVTHGVLLWKPVLFFARVGGDLWFRLCILMWVGHGHVGWLSCVCLSRWGVLVSTVVCVDPLRVVYFTNVC